MSRHRVTTCVDKVVDFFKLPSNPRNELERPFPANVNVPLKLSCKSTIKYTMLDTRAHVNPLSTSGCSSDAQIHNLMELTEIRLISKRTEGTLNRPNMRCAARSLSDSLKSPGVLDRTVTARESLREATYTERNDWFQISVKEVVMRAWRSHS